MTKFSRPGYIFHPVKEEARDTSFWWPPFAFLEKDNVIMVLCPLSRVQQILPHRLALKNSFSFYHIPWIVSRSGDYQFINTDLKQVSLGWLSFELLLFRKRAFGVIAFIISKTCRPCHLRVVAGTKRGYSQRHPHLPLRVRLPLSAPQTWSYSTLFKHF